MLEMQLSLISHQLGVTVQAQTPLGITTDSSTDNAPHNGQFITVRGDPWRAPDCTVWPILRRKLCAVQVDSARSSSELSGLGNRCMGHFINLIMRPYYYSMVEDDSEEPEDSGYEMDDSIPSLVSID